MRKYNIGDLYDDGTMRGVVFAVCDEGSHGTILSLDESAEPLAWVRGETEGRLYMRCDSRNDGRDNMFRLICRPEWRESYPALFWCYSHGSKWYLPAIEELSHLLLNEEVYSTVNKTLTEVGGVPLGERHSSSGYWSSTDSNHEVCGTFTAYCFRMYYMQEHRTDKFEKYFVRAVARF